jgi:hypothetical protein
MEEIRRRARAQRRARRRNQTIAAFAGVGLVVAVGANVRALQNRPNVLLGPGAASETDDGSRVTEFPTQTASPTDSPTTSPPDPPTEPPTEIPTAVVTSATGVRLPSTVTAPPDTWVGARYEGDLIEIVASSPAGDRVLHSSQASSVDHGRVLYSRYPEDVALRTDTGEVYVGLCCEPTSGSIYVTSLDGSRELDFAYLQGFRIDVSPVMVAAADAYGFSSVRMHEGRRVRPLAEVADVAVDPLEPRAAQLVDAARIQPLGEAPPPRDPALRLLRPRSPGTFDQGLTGLPGQYCAITFAARDQVVLLRAARETKIRGCIGDQLDVLDLRTNELHRSVVTLADQTSQLSADDTGEHFIYAANSGVYWHTLDGETGQLTADNYTAADW